MSWSLSAKADVREIGGALRQEYDRLVHLSGGAILGEAEHTAINAALAAANQIATSGAVGTSGVGVVISGHTDAAGRTGTVSMSLSSYELEPPAIGPVEGRPESRLRTTLEDAVSTTNPFGPGSELTEPVGQTDTDAFLAAQGERERIERDRNDDEQIRARREEALKLQRQAAETGTVAGADVVIGPERRPNDPVTQAQEERDRELAAGPSPANPNQEPNPNAAFIDGHTELSAPSSPADAPVVTEHPPGTNPNALGETESSVDGQALLAQPPDGAVETLAEAPAVPEGTPPTDDPPAADNLDDIDDPGETTKAALQELCAANGLAVSGTKAELLDRLHEAGVSVPPADPEA